MAGGKGQGDQGGKVEEKGCGEERRGKGIEDKEHEVCAREKPGEPYRDPEAEP